MKLIFVLTPFRFFVFISVALFVFAIGSPARQALAQGARPVVEFLHVWRTRGEIEALSVYRDEMRARGVEWYDEAVTGNLVALQVELSQKIARGVAPSVVLWIGGETLPGLVEAGVLRRIRFDGSGAEDQIRPEVMKLISDQEDGLLAMPLGIHIQNFMIYNQDVMDRFSLDLPDSWEQFLSYGEILQENGIDLIGWSDQQWQRRQLFIGILASVLTPEQFSRLQGARREIDDLRPQMARAIEIFFALSKYNRLKSKESDWFDVTEAVGAGTILSQILGDFAAPVLEGRANITCALAPGSDYQVWGFDSVAFVNVTDEVYLAGQDVFAEVLLNPEVNKRYVKYKGGIPVLTGIAPEELAPCHADSLRRWEAGGARIPTGDDQWRKRLGLIGEFTSELGLLEAQGAEKSADVLIELLKQL